MVKEWNEQWSKQLKRHALVKEINKLCYELSGIKGRIPLRSSVPIIRKRYLRLLDCESTNELTLEGLEGLESLLNARINSIHKYESLFNKFYLPRKYAKN